MTVATPRLQRALALTVSLAALCGCASTETDPRCSIDASERHRAVIARAINTSSLWQAYLDEASSGEVVVDFLFETERETRGGYRGGDYDPGTLHVYFEVYGGAGDQIYRRKGDIALADFIIGSFGPDTTREEIQEAAYRATEKNVYPYLGRWVDLAAIRAMGRDGSSAFDSVLRGVIEEDWSTDEMIAEARKALAGTS